MALVLAVAARPAAAGTLPSLLVLGVQNEVEGEEEWQDQRLGMGIRGKLTQIYADSGAFTLIEEKDLAESVQEALGGYWLRERSAEELQDLDRLHDRTGADWIAHGTLEYIGVTRDRVQGLVGGRRWAYRVRLRLCLHGVGGQSLCQDGAGRSTTKVLGAVVEYRGDEVAFDQAGPAEAVERALIDAFNRLMPKWEHLL